MDDFEKSVFKQEIQRQCDYAAAARREMTRALDAGELDSSFWFWTQAFLIAAANVSKLLWGKDAAAAARRRDLRDDLGVTDDSPIRPRSIRNHFEHFDERIEDAVRTGAVVDTNFVPKGAIDAGPRKHSYLRNYDAGTDTLMFWHDEIHVGTVVEELIRIGRAANS
jgi:hypothetical protein